MKRVSMVLCFLIFGWASSWAAPTGGSFGAGVVLGDPIGPTIKYWLTSHRAFDAGVGIDDDTVFYADYLWQGWDRSRKGIPGTLGGYLGFGPRFEAVDHGDNKFGLRTVAGINHFFSRYPIEIFAEFVPVFQVDPELDADVDVGIGLRVYFYTKNMAVR